LGESEVGIRRGYFLFGSAHGRCGALDGSPRLCIVDYREHLPALYAISLMYAEFHDVPHHLARQLCGFRRAYRSHCFQQIGNVNPLHRQHGDIAHGFWRRGRRLSLTSATAKPGQKHCQGNKTRENEIAASHGVTTGD
jgi:hypothetical protein